MIKLSTLRSDTLLCVGNNYDGELRVMDKAEFLESAYFLDYPVEPFPEVRLADPCVSTFDLRKTIERIGEDDTYEGWDEDVYDSLKNEPETKAFLELVKRTFEAHPTYYEGKLVEIDMLPPARKELHNEL